MAGHRIARVAIAVLTASATSRGAAAQPGEPAGEAPIAPAKDPKIAKKWLAAGQQLMQKGSYLASRNRSDEARPQFENAVTAYLRAIEAGDDVNVYFELAAAEEKIGKLGDAVKHLRRVAHAQAGVRPEVVTKATGKLEELLAKVGLVTLFVAPPGASITLGGSELGLSPLAEPLVLMPGTYTLAFQAAGFQPREAELKVEPGSESERAIELEPVKVIVEPVKPAVVEDVPHDEAPPRPSRLPLYAGAAITVAAGGAAGVLGALAIRQHTTFTRRSTPAADREDAQANGTRLAHLSDAAAITAAAAASFTAYWYFYRYRRRLTNSTGDRAGNPGDHPTGRHSPPIQTKLDVVPWVQPQLGGMTVAGSF